MLNRRASSEVGRESSGSTRGRWKKVTRLVVFWMTATIWYGGPAKLS